MVQKGQKGHPLQFDDGDICQMWKTQSQNRRPTFVDRRQRYWFCQYDCEFRGQRPNQRWSVPGRAAMGLRSMAGCLPATNLCCRKNKGEELDPATLPGSVETAGCIFGLGPGKSRALGLPRRQYG